MTLHATTAMAVTILPGESIANAAEPKSKPTEKALLDGVEAKSKSVALLDGVDTNSNDTSAPVAIVSDQISMAKGTYSVHHDECYTVPDFYDSAYSVRQPWQDANTNFGAALSAHGHYRFLFSPSGNYQNFYHVFSMSRAPSFHQASPVPTFYSEVENCNETTFSPPQKGKDFQSYRPFAAESRGYTRSYFYGSLK